MDKQKKIALRISGVIFGLVALLHLARLIFRVEIIAGGVSIPMWLSAVGFVVAGGLTVWMLNISKK
ncbi:MAG: hypothetical protein NTY47_01400 [Candidatus Omnitrophica bacterium]|nr:hypothetical protein [Candidatus Omnitrophota bacterium]